MKASCKVYIASSLDGFIAKPDGDVDWLDHPSYTLEGEGFGYTEFMDSISALIMGRNTYEKVLTFGEWHYSKPVFVITSQDLNIPDELTDKVFLIKGSPSEIVSELANKGFSSLYIDGGKTIQSFLKEGLISEMTITQIPVLLGDGIPLFALLEEEIHLKLRSSISFANGFILSTYEVINKTS
ncbi:MAG: dihydrofolate reductase family protein [Balneolaceae bacterium]